MNETSYKRENLETLSKRLRRVLEITRDLPVREFEHVSEWRFIKCFFSNESDYKIALRSLVEHGHTIDSCQNGAGIRFIVVENDAK